MSRKVTIKDTISEEFQVPYQLGFEIGVQIRSCGLQVKTVAKRFKNPYGRKTPEYAAFDYGKLEGFSKIPRTTEFLPRPHELGAICSKCGSNDLEWSEWENHIWCNTCKYETDNFESKIGEIDASHLAKANRWDRDKKILECSDPITGEKVFIADYVIVAIANLPVRVENLTKDSVDLIPVYSENLSKGEWWKEYSHQLEISPESLTGTLGDIQEMMNADKITVVRKKGDFDLLSFVS